MFPSLTRRVSIAALVLFSSVLGSPATAQGSKPPKPRLASQWKIHKDYVASGCGPTSIYNWLATGTPVMRAALEKFEGGGAPQRTVDRIIETYGARPSVFYPTRTRFVAGNGTGPLNLMVMAQEVLRENAKNTLAITGSFLHRRDGESSEAHLERVTARFGRSIRAGVPVLLHIRGYRTKPKDGQKLQLFGHHVVIRAIRATKKGASEIRYIEPCGPAVRRAYLRVAEFEFTAPTDASVLRNGRATYRSKVQTGRPTLEFATPGVSFVSSKIPHITVANYATLAASKASGAAPKAADKK